MGVESVLIDFRQIGSFDRRLNHQLLTLRQYVVDTPMDYASSGVDIDAEGAAIASLIQSLSGSVRKPGTRGAPVPLPG